jgi:AcrR family transcriptional regulator
MTQRSQRATDRRHDIAAAALVCLQQGGYAALTARKIAAEAGLSLGHISYHFASMDEVLSEAYRLASANLGKAEAALLAAGPTPEATTPADRLAAFLTAGFTPAILTPAHLRVRIDLWSAALSHPAIAETELALYTDYRARLIGHLTALAVPAREARIAAVADLIMAALDGLWLDWMRRRDEGAVQNGLALCQKIAWSELAQPIG